MIKILGKQLDPNKINEYKNNSVESKVLVKLAESKTVYNYNSVNDFINRNQN
jgi:hypothetical protein